MKLTKAKVGAIMNVEGLIGCKVDKLWTIEVIQSHLNQKISFRINHADEDSKLLAKERKRKIQGVNRNDQSWLDQNEAILNFKCHNIIFAFHYELPDTSSN